MALAAASKAREQRLRVNDPCGSGRGEESQTMTFSAFLNWSSSFMSISERNPPKWFPFPEELKMGTRGKTRIPLRRNFIAISTHALTIFKYLLIAIGWLLILKLLLSIQYEMFNWFDTSGLT
jgi:hypothetical protein